MCGFRMFFDILAVVHYNIEASIPVDRRRGE